MKLRTVGVAAAVLSTIWAFSIPDAQLFREPRAVRIICFHLPCDFIAPVMAIFAAVAGFMYLRTLKTVWAARLAASFEIATVVSILVELTGVVFSYAQWGDWWHGDARQTSILVVCLLMTGGMALRAAISDPERRNRASAAYSLATVIPFLFLTFVFPRLPAVAKDSLHPTNTVVQGGFDRYYWSAIMGVLIAMVLIIIDLFKRRVELEFWEEQGA